MSRLFVLLAASTLAFPALAQTGPAPAAARAALATTEVKPALTPRRPDAKQARQQTASDSEVFRQQLAMAAAGNAQAMAYVGDGYSRGRGVAQNDSEAVRWYRAAAAAGHALGMNSLGWMYEQGHGVAQNDTEAVRWYRAAAAAGYAIAMNNLGVMYDQGRGVAQDPAVAAGWFLAAERGGIRWFREFVSVLRPETIRAVQRRLRDAGYYHGALDASWGPSSLAALDAYVAHR